MARETGAQPPYAFETRQIHAGELIDAEAFARFPLIYQVAGYVFENFEDGVERFAPRSTTIGARN